MCYNVYMNEHPKPFESPLIPHVEAIREWRKQRKSWVKIAELLKERGIHSTTTTIYRFLKRHNKRPGAYGYAAHPLVSVSVENGEQKPKGIMPRRNIDTAKLSEAFGEPITEHLTKQQ